MAVGGDTGAALALLQPDARRRYWRLVALQSATALLDLAGVLLFGLSGLLVVSAAGGGGASGIAGETLSALGLAGADPTVVALGAGLVAGLLLIAKSALTLLVIARVNVFLGDQAARVSSDLVRRYLGQGLVKVQAGQSQDTVMALTRGVSAAIVSTLSAFSSLVADLVLMGVLAAALVLVDPLLSLAAVGYFGAVSWLIQRHSGEAVRRSAAASYDADVASLTSLQNAIATYRELAVSDRIGAVEDEVGRQRWIASRQRAIQVVHAQAPRFVLESALVVAGVGLTSVVVLTRDADVAVGTLALFLAATARILPSLMRLNSARLQLRGVSGEARAALRLAGQLAEPDEEPLDLTDPAPAGGLGLEVSGVRYQYPGRPVPAIDGVSLSLPAGSSLAIVGATGAGKSTLADLVLGLLEPDEGRVTLGGHRPGQLIRNRPGAVAYVPQDVQLIAGTVRDNVALAVASEEVDDGRVWEALRRAWLADVVAGLDGLDTVVGERGVRLSGGQRQRLGLARALYTRPQLLVLDEATSALDAQTEAGVTDMLGGLSGEVTLVTIAHRLATVRRADLLVYLADGRMVAAGTFDEVRRQVPDFDRQAQLLGL